jgi:hypothetical protein
MVCFGVSILCLIRNASFGRRDVVVWHRIAFFFWLFGLQVGHHGLEPLWAVVVLVPSEKRL